MRSGSLVRQCLVISGCHDGRRGEAKGRNEKPGEGGRGGGVGRHREGERERKEGEGEEEKRIHRRLSGT